jgi:heme exporter protein CcmD
MSYASYIWSAYGAAAALLVALLIASLRGLRKREAELAEAESTVGRRRRGGSTP